MVIQQLSFIEEKWRVVRESDFRAGTREFYYFGILIFAVITLFTGPSSSYYTRELLETLSSPSGIEVVHTSDYSTDAGHTPTSSTEELQLNDPTIELSPHVLRLWRQGSATQPKTKLILTDFGWNHPNQTKGLTEFTRSLRSRELLQAFVDHPHFDPSFDWTDAMENENTWDTSINYIVLLDIETCFEPSYPQIKMRFELNADRTGGRVVTAVNSGRNPCFHPCDDIIQQVLGSPLFRQVPQATLLYLDCSGNGPVETFRHQRITSPQLSMLTLSSGPQNLREDIDMGLMPPAVNPVTLKDSQEAAIRSCRAELPSERPYLLTFVGSWRQNSPREALFDLDDGQQKDVILKKTLQFKTMIRKKQTNSTFDSLLQDSLFAAAPRGVNRFSYRFTEVLSAGAIPVVHSDGWVLPYRKELVDWTKCAIVIPEANMNQTLDILRSISSKERCRMRQHCYYEIYQKYMAHPSGTIQGILDSIEARDRVRSSSQ